MVIIWTNKASRESKKVFNTMGKMAKGSRYTLTRLNFKEVLAINDHQNHDKQDERTRTLLSSTSFRKLLRNM